MSKIIDCGDVTLSVNLSLSMRFPGPVAKTEKEIDDRKMIAKKLDEFRLVQNIDSVEQALLDALVDHCGYTPDLIKKNIEDREAARQKLIKEEIDGRELKKNKRTSRRA